MKCYFKILVFSLIFTSCGALRYGKTSDFALINDAKNLEGHFLNRIKENRNTMSILSCFNIRDYANYVAIVSEDPNEIKLIYYNDSARQERIFTGEMKKNYFEIFFKDEQFYIPLIYGTYNIDRIRVGKTKEGKLLIRKYTNQSGYLLLLAGGYNYETPYIFPCIKEHKDYMPIHENGLWGYSDSLGNIVIQKKYDFVNIFEKDVARVKLNNKWGLINRQGEEIAPVKYDEISLIDTVFPPPIFRATIGGKTGILDINGNEIIPVIYDFVAYSNMGHYGLFSIRLGDKRGYATRTQVVIPAIYSEITGSTKFINGSAGFSAKRDEQWFIVDRHGYEYEVGRNRNPILETKRKIQFEEQNIE